MTTGTGTLFAARLVRITHTRCDEYDGTEYVLAPHDWTDEKIGDEINAVSKELIEDAKKVKDSPLKPPHHAPFTEFPDQKVSAVLALHEAQKLAYKAWLDENSYLTRSFETRLRERGFYAIWDKDDETGAPGVVDESVWWGHNHGTKLNYKHMEPIDLG